MKGFKGFPEKDSPSVSLPSAFFTELLPAIDHFGEMKVCLYALWALGRADRGRPYLLRSEMAADRLFMESLSSPGLSNDEVLEEGLERAVARGVLLRASPDADDAGEAVYLLNSAQGRAALAGLERDDWLPGGDPEDRVQLRRDRPNIFNLYEQNIGPLTPLIAETLEEAEATYPSGWIEDAVRIAVENNVRKWRYVSAILEDWQTRGRDDREDRGDSEKARQRYLEIYKRFNES